MLEQKSRFLFLSNKGFTEQNVPRTGDATFPLGLVSSRMDTALYCLLCSNFTKSSSDHSVHKECVDLGNAYFTLHELVKDFFFSCKKFLVRNPQLPESIVSVLVESRCLL